MVHKAPVSLADSVPACLQPGERLGSGQVTDCPPQPSPQVYVSRDPALHAAGLGAALGWRSACWWSARREPGRR